MKLYQIERRQSGETGGERRKNCFHALVSLDWVPQSFYSHPLHPIGCVSTDWNGWDKPLVQDLRQAPIKDACRFIAKQALANRAGRQLVFQQ